jgi:hypothetical protein
VTVISDATGFEVPSPTLPTVAVVLCTWNGGRWLGELLASIAQQDLLPDELIVQDDGSTDDTIEVVEAFARSAPFRVELAVNDARIGSTANFERALGRSTAQVVALADQDDLWYPEKLACLVGALAEDPILTLTFSDADLLDEHGRRTGRRLWQGRGNQHLLTTHEIVPGPWFARRALSTGCTMVARRRAVEASLPFPDCLDEPSAPMRHDRWLSLVAAAVGTVRALPEPLLGFRVHPAQQTGVLTSKQLRSRLLGTAAATTRPPDPMLAEGHRARARQILVAADRADELGDFAEADELRRIAAHREARADLGSTVTRRLTTIGREFVSGGYDRSAIGLSGAAADVVRSIRPNGARTTS